MTHISPFALAAYGALGALIGLVYFWGLGWNVQLYASGGSGWKALAVHVLRLVGIVVIFALCARQGAAALLSNFAGFLAVRTVAIDRKRSSAGSNT
jgi:F1F0 ATPase subunit 2